MIAGFGLLGWRLRKRAGEVSHFSHSCNACCTGFHSGHIMLGAAFEFTPKFPKFAPLDIRLRWLRRVGIDGRKSGRKASALRTRPTRGLCPRSFCLSDYALRRIRRLCRRLSVASIRQQVSRRDFKSLVFHPALRKKFKQFTGPATN